MSIPSHSTARLRCAERHQTEMFGRSLDENLPPDHAARVIWSYVDGLDLSAMYEKIRSVEGQAGQPTIDPRIMLALWLLATTQGVGTPGRWIVYAMSTLLIVGCAVVSGPTITRCRTFGCTTGRRSTNC